MRNLGAAAGIDNVHLRGHLIVGAEPGAGGERDHIIGVVVGEAPRISQGELLEGIPDAIVGTGLGKVVTRRGA